MPASVKPLTPAPQMAMRGVVGALANERVERSVVARRLMLFTVLARFLGFVVFQGFEYVASGAQCEIPPNSGLCSSSTV